MSDPAPAMVAESLERLADPRAMRGIPMIGSECDGAIPGMVPHRNKRFDRWSGR